MENCNIDATGAFAGLTGGLGSAGGYFNIKVTGGKYGFIGLDPSITQELLFVGMTFLQQENAVFRGVSWKGHVIVGLHIQKDSPRIFDQSIPGSETIFGVGGGFVDAEGVSIIDAKIDITNDDPNEAVFWLQGGNNFYLQNVFVSSNVTHIARHTNGNSILQNTHPDFAGSTDYSKIKTFAHQKLISNKFVLWDFGKFNRRTTDSLDVHTSDYNPTAQELLDKHVLNVEETPCVFSGNPNNPIASDIKIIQAIRGIDDTWDRGLIQATIDLPTTTKVFIPRGVFLILSLIHI